MHQTVVLRASRHGVNLLVALLAGFATTQAVAQVGPAQVDSDSPFVRARGALVQVEVIDAAVQDALEIYKSDLPDEEKRKKLKKIRIQQRFRLLVSGVAITPYEVVTPALHPTARLRVILTFHDGTQHAASVVGTDPRTNLALVRSSAKVPYHLAPHAEAQTEKQQVFLVGHTVISEVAAAGLVTQVRMGARLRDLYAPRNAPAIPMGTVFVVAAPTAPCNPGTACLDRNGRLIGIVLGCAPPQVMQQQAGGALASYERSFVVPSERMLRIVKALRKHRRVIRAEFGFVLKPISAALRAQIPEIPAGAATVTLRDAEGPAAKAGVRSNDILISVAGKKPANRDELREALNACEPGKPTRCKLLRAGKLVAVTVKPTEQK